MFCVNAEDPALNICPSSSFSFTKFCGLLKALDFGNPDLLS